MKLYLAEITIPYETGCIVGIYSTREKAEHALLMEDFSGGNKEVTEMELDQDCPVPVNTIPVINTIDTELEEEEPSDYMIG